MSCSSRHGLLWNLQVSEPLMELPSKASTAEIGGCSRTIWSQLVVTGCGVVPMASVPTVTSNRSDSHDPRILPSSRTARATAWGALGPPTVMYPTKQHGERGPGQNNRSAGSDPSPIADP